MKKRNRIEIKKFRKSRRYYVSNLSKMGSVATSKYLSGVIDDSVRRKMFVNSSIDNSASKNINEHLYKSNLENDDASPNQEKILNSYRTEEPILDSSSEQNSDNSKQNGDPSKQNGEPSKQNGDPSQQNGDSSEQNGPKVLARALLKNLYSTGEDVVR